jgi:NAD(P)-dependent dehydrogenase (short-subunit alcohol dehydrogenase family)
VAIVVDTGAVAGASDVDQRDHSGRSDDERRTYGPMTEASDLLGLSGAVALVTGAGAGLGKGTALQLARAGCDVAVVDIDDGLARTTVKEIEALHRRAISIHADVLVEDDVKRMVETVRTELGSLKVGVNVVGSVGTPAKSFLDLSLDEWNTPIARNLTSTFLCMRAEAVAMVRDGVDGRIVNFASSSGIVGAPNIAHYGAANAGVIHFTKSASMELAPYGIRVNCVVPGTHVTERNQRMLADPATPESTREFWRLAALAPPLGRLGEAWETGGAALFLASDLSSYMTGHSVISDGGVSHTTNRPPVGMPMKPEALRDLV